MAREITLVHFQKIKTQNGENENEKDRFDR